MITFQAILKQSGKTATGIEVPEEVVAALGSGKRPAVRVTVQGYSYRTTVGAMGGQAMIPVSAEHRAAAGIAAGDELTVELELDTEPRELVLPDDFKEALALDDAAERFFAGLSYSNKRRLTLPIEGAKTAETRQRRIDKTIGLLREGRVE